VEDKVLLLDNAGQLDCVDRFCYLGDVNVIGDGGGAEEATRARVKCAWSKFMELAPIFTTRGASLKLKGKIYRASVQTVMVYGSETWAEKVEDVRRLVRTETAMARWMCGVMLKDRKASDELLGRLGVEDVVEVMRRGRLLWFGYVERKHGMIGWRCVEIWLWKVLEEGVGRGKRGMSV
jgi:hypothetical protein